MLSLALFSPPGEGKAACGKQGEVGVGGRGLFAVLTLAFFSLAPAALRGANQLAGRNVGRKTARRFLLKVVVAGQGVCVSGAKSGGGTVFAESCGGGKKPFVWVVAGQGYLCGRAKAKNERRGEALAEEGQRGKKWGRFKTGKGPRGGRNAFARAFSENLGCRERVLASNCNKNKIFLKNT